MAASCSVIVRLGFRGFASGVVACRVGVRHGVFAATWSGEVLESPPPRFGALLACCNDLMSAIGTDDPVNKMPFGKNHHGSPLRRGAAARG